MNPLFSILIPVCNQEGKMDNCIKSIKAQTFSDFEVIMVDDGSKDGSYAEMKAIAAADERFQVVQHDGNKSLLAARYTGMTNANGQYILFVDSDDYIEADTLMSLKEFLDEKPVDIVRFGFRYEPKGKDWFQPESEDPLMDTMMGQIAPAIWKNCFAKRVIDKVIANSEPFYCNMGEDVCLCGLLYSCAESVEKIDRIFYHYEIGNGMSSQRTNLSIEKLHRDMASIKASAAHLTAFVEKMNPAYLEGVKRAIRTMYRTVMVQNTLFEEDNVKIVRVMNEFDNEDFADIFDFGCKKLLPYIIKKQMGIMENFSIVED